MQKHGSRLQTRVDFTTITLEDIVDLRNLNIEASICDLSEDEEERKREEEIAEQEYQECLSVREVRDNVQTLVQEDNIECSTSEDLCTNSEEIAIPEEVR